MVSTKCSLMVEPTGDGDHSACWLLQRAFGQWFSKVIFFAAAFPRNPLLSVRRLSSPPLRILVACKCCENFRIIYLSMRTCWLCNAATVTGYWGRVSSCCSGGKHQVCNDCYKVSLQLVYGDSNAGGGGNTTGSLHECDMLVSTAVKTTSDASLYEEMASYPLGTSLEVSSCASSRGCSVSLLPLHSVQGLRFTTPVHYPLQVAVEKASSGTCHLAPFTEGQNTARAGLAFLILAVAVAIASVVLPARTVSPEDDDTTSTSTAGVTLILLRVSLSASEAHWEFFLARRVRMDEHLD
jgi:hypothetical protein